MKDDFITNGNFSNYLTYKNLSKSFNDVINNKNQIANIDYLISDLIRLNPNYYKTYVLAADYFSSVNDTVNTHKYLEKALNCEFENTITKEIITERLNY